VTVFQIVDEPVTTRGPLLHARGVLQVIHFCIACLPLLQRQIAAEQTKFNRGRDEMEGLYLDRLTQLLPEIETDGSPERRS
jgi:hypothetical protein